MTNDQSLIALIQAGDELAAEQLYQRYAARVLGLVKSQMADYLQARTEPEDIVQSVFKSIFRGVSHGGYSAPEGGSLWHLMAVVAVNKVRRNATRQAADKRDARRTESLQDLEERIVNHRLDIRDIQCALSEAIECLTPPEREVVMERVQGFTVEEISERVGKSRRTVERLLQHARQTLASELIMDEPL